MSEDRNSSGRDVDETLEDAFGVNFRALRTMRDVLFRTRTVFEAFASGDRQTYTPTIRLFVGLIAIQVFVSFLWGGYAGLLLSQWQSQPTSIPAMENLFGASIEDIAEHYGNAATFLHAIVVGGFTAFSAFLIGAYNRSLNWVARLNITFTVLSGGTLLGLVLLTLAALANHVEMINWAPAVVFLSYWFFFARGAPGVLAQTRAGAVLKGLLFSAVTMLLVVLGGLVMAILAFGWVFSQVS